MAPQEEAQQTREAIFQIGKIQPEEMLSLDNNDERSREILGIIVSSGLAINIIRSILWGLEVTIYLQDGSKVVVNKRNLV